jgi:hypothetical protein
MAPPELRKTVDMMNQAAKITVSPNEKILLNIGCGNSGNDRMPASIKGPQWKEIRIDINPEVQPDLVASFAHLENVQGGMVDAIWSSHNLEHMPWHECQMALKESLRVLKPDGVMVLTMPDLKQVAKLVLEGKLMEVAYDSPAGPITALNMLYGHRVSQKPGNTHMAHRCGFTTQSLAQCLFDVGFTDIKIFKGNCYDLWAVAGTQQLPETLLHELKLQHA